MDDGDRKIASFRDVFGIPDENTRATAQRQEPELRPKVRLAMTDVMRTAGPPVRSIYVDMPNGLAVQLTRIRGTKMQFDMMRREYIWQFDVAMSEEDLRAMAEVAVSPNGTYPGDVLFIPGEPQPVKVYASNELEQRFANLEIPNEEKKK